MNELSKDFVTHKLIIAWVWTKYITESFAKDIFNKLNSNDKTIKISNPNNLTYIEKYKNEVQLLPIDWEDRNIEDKIALSWLNQRQKEEVRNIIEDRRKEKKPITDIILDNIIESVWKK